MTNDNEENVRDALHEIFAAADGINQTADIAIGYRQTLLDAGIGHDVADTMAMEFHQMLCVGGIEYSRKQSDDRRLVLLQLELQVARVRALVKGVPRAVITDW